METITHLREALSGALDFFWRRNKSYNWLEIFLHLVFIITICYAVILFLG